jgi:ABC transport system ATP-binding/permease protein
VITSTLVFEPGGQVKSYAGGYADWARRGKRLVEMDNPHRSKSNEQPTLRNGAEPTSATPKSATGKLSYKFKRELEQLPDRIEALENEIATLEIQTTQLEFYARPYEQVQPLLEKLKTKRDELEHAVDRWAELEAQQL